MVEEYHRDNKMSPKLNKKPKQEPKSEDKTKKANRLRFESFNLKRILILIFFSSIFICF